MKKRNMMAAVCLMATMAVATGCKDSKGGAEGGKANSEAKAQKKQKKDDLKDVFIYTLEHRKKKYQPEEKEKRMAISKVLESVNEREFADNKALEEVFFHENTKHVVNGAFAGCSNLKAVHFPGVVPVINDEAFLDCSSLQNLKVDVYTVGLDAFKNCTSLQTAHFGPNLYWLRDGAFENCKNLRSILMGITISKMEEPFKGCTSVQEFAVPNDVKNRLFGMLSESQPNWRTIYLLTTEYYALPKNCTPNDKCTLYVPDAYLEQFRGDAGWSQFGKIEPLSKTKYFTAEGFWK